jgi:hypothetical protein
VLHVTQVDVQGSEDEGDAEDEARLEQRDHQEQRDPGKDHVAEGEQEHAQHTELDEERHEQGQHGRDDKELSPEVDLLDQVRVPEQHFGGCSHRLRQELVGEQTAQQEEHEAVEPARIADRGLHLEELGEHDPVDEYGCEWVDE